MMEICTVENIQKTHEIAIMENKTERKKIF